MSLLHKSLLAFGLLLASALAPSGTALAANNSDLCGRLPCFDAHCYNAPYISILCGMYLNNRILHRKFQFRAKPCLPCAA